ncbi:TPA: phage tail tape measure protein [Acinetobacter baumannii]|uniref:phage tail tape measure protein n=1 Tax=Acinetobacter baumannii TaxID=470 RepID=UPI00338E4BF1
MSNLKLEVLFNAVDKLSGPIKTIIGGSKTLSDAFKKTSSELKALEAQQRKISGFRQLKEQSEKTAQAIEQNKETLKQLKTAMNIGAPTEQMVKDLARAEAAQKRLKAAQKNQGSEMTALVRELNQAGISVDNLADDESELKNKIHLTTMEINKQKESLERHQKAQKQYEQMQGRMAKASDLAKKGLAIGAVGTAGMAYTLKQYEDAEDAAMGLRVSMMQANGQVSKEYAEINKLANGLGTKLPGTTADFQNMMAVLIQQGISAKAILGGVGEAAGYLGVQMKMPFADAAEFAAKMQDATKTTEKDMLGLMDVIQRSYYLGVDSGNMLQGFAKISAGMKTIKAEGLEGAKAIAPLLVMADQAAMAGEAAGNAYSKIFKSMMDTKGIAKALKDSGTGIQMNFTDGKGEFGGLDKMFKQLEKLKGLSTEKRLPILSDMFGNDAETIQALNLLIDKGQTGYNEVIAKMQKQADLQTRVNAQLSTLKNLKDAAGGTFTSMLALFGEQLAPQFKILITGFTNVTENVTTWAQKNPELANTIAKVVAGGVLLVGGISAIALGLVSILGPLAMLRMSLGVLGGGFGIITGFLKLFLMPIKILGTSLLWLGKIFLTVSRFIMANPIILAVTALATIGYLIYKNWEPIKGFFGTLWTGITSTFNTGINYLKSIIKSIDSVFANNPILNVLLPFIGIPRMIIANWSGITSFVSSVWLSITTGASNAWNSIIGYFSPIGAWFSAKWEYLKSLTSVAWSGIKAIVSDAWNGLITVVTNNSLFQNIVAGWTTIFTYLGTLKDRMLSIGRNIIDGLVSGIKSGFDGLKSIWTTINSYMPSFMKKKMDIRSPSHVMAGLGGHVVDGISVGVNRQTPALQTQFSKTLGVFDTSAKTDTTNKTIRTTPVKPLMVSGKNPPSFMSNDTINVHIHVKEGSVVKGTADALRQELRRVAQEEQNAKRKFLTDTE